MTLPDPALLFGSLDTDMLEVSSRRNELTHVSEVLAESGIPVADSLKERMSEELVLLIEEEGIRNPESERRCSA